MTEKAQEFIMLYFGMKFKAIYFIALLPHMMLFILLINGFLQDGYSDGLKTFFTVNVQVLNQRTAWKDACVQILFSLGVCWGDWTARARYNKFHNDVLRDTLIISFGNLITSFFAGFVTFMYVGIFIKRTGTPFVRLVDTGVSLAFVIFPEAIATMFAAPLWSLLFFLMLIVFGLRTMFLLIETCVTAFTDVFKKTQKYQIYVGLSICSAMFFIGLSMTTPGGVYIVQFMDFYVTGWNLLIVASFMCMALTYYKFNRFSEDIRIMLKDKSCRYIRWNTVKFYFVVAWAFVTPVLLLITILISVYKQELPSYGKVKFPQSYIGWILLAATLCLCVCPMIVKKFKSKAAMATLLEPTKEWGPAEVSHRKLVTYVDDFEVDPFQPKS